MADIVDEEGDQLLGELIGSIVIRAVGHQCRHPISIMVSTDKVIAGSLTCRVRAMWIILAVLCKESTIESQGPIDLISRDVIEALPFILLWTSFPDFTSGLQERECA